MKRKLDRIRPRRETSPPSDSNRSPRNAYKQASPRGVARNRRHPRVKRKPDRIRPRGETSRPLFPIARQGMRTSKPPRGALREIDAILARSASPIESDHAEKRRILYRAPRNARKRASPRGAARNRRRPRVKRKPARIRPRREASRAKDCVQAAFPERHCAKSTPFSRKAQARSNQTAQRSFAPLLPIARQELCASSLP